MPFMNKHRTSSVPFLSNLLISQALAVDLASLLHRTAQYLVAPSMYYFPVPYRKNIEFVLIRIREKETQQVDFNWELFQNQVTYFLKSSNRLDSIYSAVISTGDFISSCGLHNVKMFDM